MRRTELVRRLEGVPDFDAPSAAWEQVVTPADAAAELLFEALERGDLDGSVVDLGSGTGRLAIGAALLGADPVVGIEHSAAAVARARAASGSAGASVRFEVGTLPDPDIPEGTIVMNPPFGAQRAHADRPFWATALRPGRRAVYAFALSDSRTFIEERAVERATKIEEVRPVRWRLPATFAHHRARSVALSVDLWILRTDGSEE